MGRYGKDSLIREISIADTKKLDKQTAALARSYLNQYSFEEVRSVSNGAAVFYLWVSMAHKCDCTWYLVKLHLSKEISVNQHSAGDILLFTSKN